jgi:hypothetical protein
MKTGFLKKVVWRKSKTDPKKWIIVYHFGARAKSELKRGFKDDTYRPAILAVEIADIEEIEELIESGGKLMTTMIVKSLEINKGLSDDFFNPEKAKVKGFSMQDMMKKMMEKEDE